MNILVTDQFPELGGAQLCLLDMLPAIQARGWYTIVAAPSDGPLLERARAKGAEIVPLDIGKYSRGTKSFVDAGRYAVRSFAAGEALRDIAARRHADCIYVNGPRLMPIVAWHCGVRFPVVFHCHSYVRQPAAAWLLRWSLRHTNAAVIANSRFVRGPLGEIEPFVIENGVADQARRRQPYGRARIGLIGRIAPEKGQLELVRAGRFLSANSQIVICGEATDQQYAAEVRRQAAGQAVEFTGWVDDVAELLASLDLLVVPSSHWEATTRVIPEAFSAGVCVLATNAGGIRELVEEGETGFLLDSLEPEALARRISEVLARDRTAVTTNARRVYEQRFRLVDYQTCVLAIIEKALKQQPGGNREYRS